VLRERFDAVHADYEDEVEKDEVTRDALSAAAKATARLTDQQRALIDQMQAWASAAEGRADSKVAGLLEWLADEDVIAIAEDDSIAWSDRRAIVFTEYRDTQRYIQGMLAARGVAGERIALIFGGMDEA
jgi:ERCC4-related helicase